MYREELKNVPRGVREAFEHMKAPNGRICCSYADGHRTDYDIRQGRYWVPIDGEWYPVPKRAVVRAENPIGEAIVWYLPQIGNEFASGPMPEGKWIILCFLPAPDV
jgi:hypothetical protein